MYLGVDIGGSKSLFAVFTEDGQVVAQHKIKTNKDYAGFLQDAQRVIHDELSAHHFTYCCFAIPGGINRLNGSIVQLGNLDWQNAPITTDLGNIVNHAPILIENDATLGGLSEAVMLQDEYKKVLYIAPGTGIGSAFIIEGKINPYLADSEAGHIIVAEGSDGYKTWEDTASGRSLLRDYGKLASELEDEHAWREFSHHFARGIQAATATLLPEVVVIGGGVGAHLHKFEQYLNDELKAMENRMVPAPLIMQAKRPEEAVIYGCYEHIKQHAQ